MKPTKVKTPKSIKCGYICYVDHFVAVVNVLENRKTEVGHAMQGNRTNNGKRIDSARRLLLRPGIATELAKRIFPDEMGCRVPGEALFVDGFGARCLWGQCPHEYLLETFRTRQNKRQNLYKLVNFARQTRTP